jgi:hypothetical protein
MDGLRQSSWFGSAMVAVAMFGWLLIVLALNAAVAHRDPNVEVPIELGLGVVVNPADGWYSAADRWEVGEHAVSLQHSGVYVAFWAEEYRGTNDQYLSEAVAALEREYESFSTLPPASVRVAGDLRGLMAHFSGVSPSLGREEGELAVVTHRGVGVVMWARAVPGQVTWAQGDLEYMLSRLVMAR